MHLQRVLTNRFGINRGPLCLGGTDLEHGVCCDTYAALIL